MANTSPDGLWSPDASDPLILRTLTAEMQASTQVALDKRQLSTFRWANSAARGSQTGMTNGDEGFQGDTGATYKYLGGVWELWNSPRNSYTPAITGGTLGSGTIAATWSMSAGTVVVDLIMTAASNTTVSSDLTFSVPVDPAVSLIINMGAGRFLDASSGGTYLATVLLLGGAFFPRPVRPAPNTYSLIQPTSSTDPFTWATGDNVRFYSVYYAY